jgi:hypothetical protein
MRLQYWKEGVRGARLEFGVTHTVTRCLDEYLIGMKSH